MDVPLQQSVAQLSDQARTRCRPLLTKHIGYKRTLLQEVGQIWPSVTIKEASATCCPSERSWSNTLFPALSNPFTSCGTSSSHSHSSYWPLLWSRPLTAPSANLMASREVCSEPA